jgi:hypothetical protein
MIRIDQEKQSLGYQKHAKNWTSAIFKSNSNSFLFVNNIKG